MRERGLKQIVGTDDIDAIVVAPHAGAWIETNKSHCNEFLKNVAPHAGAWIETRQKSYRGFFKKSLPMRERGLKLNTSFGDHDTYPVAPHAGAWIETITTLILAGTVSVAPHAGAWIETI